jgi:hypothetical protein
VFATWLRPGRWSAGDMIMALAALVLAISVFVPWFNATIMSRGQNLNGYLINPPGTVSGIAVHRFLWVAFGLALLQFGVLAVHYAPFRRAVGLPGYRQVLVVASGLSCIAVLVAFAMKPGTWYGGNDLGGGLYIVVGWSYGAKVAVGATLVSLGLAIAAIKDRPRPVRHVI